MELDRETRTSIDISSEIEVLSYVSTVQQDVIARIQLGTDAEPIVGDGSYYLRIYVDGVRIVPDNVINVAAGVTKIVASSRPLLIDAAETMSVRILGLGGDTSVTVTTIVQDVTPAAVSDFMGTGVVFVDHDYGGIDNLAYKTAGLIGIDNADITVYLKSDYDAGNRDSEYVKGRTFTDVNGRWLRAIMLDPETYTAIYYKQGAYGPNRKNFVVT